MSDTDERVERLQEICPYCDREHLCFHEADLDALTVELALKERMVEVLCHWVVCHAMQYPHTTDHHNDIPVDWSWDARHEKDHLRQCDLQRKAKRVVAAWAESRAQEAGL